MKNLIEVARPSAGAWRGDVFFVHGLDGCARKTWHPADRPDAWWPRWVSEAVPDVGVCSIGFDVSASAWRGYTMPLADRAANVLAMLDSRAVGTRPIVFIAHSLGGLLVKQMLRTAIDTGQPKWERIAQQTRGIVFLSTPHAGSELATWLSFLGGLLPLRATVTASELSMHEPALRNLNQWYRHNAERLGIKTEVYFEKRPTCGAMVVSETSADPGIARVVPVPLDADHISISKPDAPDCFLCVRVNAFIDEAIGVVPASQPQPQPQPAPSAPPQRTSEREVTLGPRQALAAGSSDFEAGLSSLEESFKRFEHLLDRGESAPAAVLEASSDLLTKSAMLMRLLREHAAVGPAACYPVAVSLVNLARGLELTLKRYLKAHQPAAEIAAIIEGYRRGLRNRVYRPAYKMAADLEHRSADETDELFLDLDASGPTHDVEFDQALDELLSDDELLAHDAAVTLVTRERDACLGYLRTTASAECARVLGRLWDHADVSLVEARKQFWDFAREAGALNDGHGRRWRDLLTLFDRSTGEFPDALAARVILDAHSQEDQHVIARCLLVHPREDVREMSLHRLRLPDFWNVLTVPNTPSRWVLALWRHIRPIAPPSYLKIFVICAREQLVDLDTADRIVPALELVREFFEVDCFHESDVFEGLVSLDEKLRTQAKALGLIVEFDLRHVSTIDAFLKQGRSPDQPPGGWHLVPLPMQRRMARRGIFPKHFVCHPIDPIAFETLPHILNADNVAEFIELVTINGRALAELAKVRRLFTLEQTRFALVSNPKAPATAITTHLPFLRKSLLLKLANSKDCSPIAVQQAKNHLKRSGTNIRPTPH